MICPKGIIDFIKSEKKLSDRFIDIINIDTINVTTQQISKKTVRDFEQWSYTEGVKISDEIKRYVFFLKSMRFIFENIFSFFCSTNPGREGKKDSQAHATAPNEMILIAKYLYLP